MKKFLVAGIIVLLFALDWAALHDILKGEPNPYAEYGMIVFSIVVFGLMILVWLRQRGSNANGLTSIESNLLRTS